MKKLLSVLLAAVLALGLMAGLTGCGDAKKYNPDNFLPEGTAENPYRIVKEKMTVNIFVPRGSMNPHFADMKMFKKLSEITNLRFEFTEADTSSYANLRSAAWEDKKNLPDLFLFNNEVSEQVIYSEYGALVPFNDANLSVAGVSVGSLIDNYMPTYKALLDNNFGIQTETDAKKVAMLEDGYMYSALCVSDVPRDLTFKMFINQRWIDNLNEDYNLGLPNADEIKTVEQYVTVLRAFKKYDANHNGNSDDEVPVSAKDMQYLRNFILASYGSVFPGVEIKNDKSGFEYTPTTEAYKKYLETVNVMYNEGLLDTSVFSITTDAQLAKKGMEGRLGSFCAAAPYIVTGQSADRYNDNVPLDEQYVTFGPLTSDYYTGSPLQWGFTNFSATGAVIPEGTKCVREIARLLDIMYSDIGVQLIAYGEEGVDWTWDEREDGTPGDGSLESDTWTFNVPNNWEGSQEDYRATISPNVGTGSALYWSYDFVGRMNDKVITALNRMSEIYMPYLKLPCPEEIKMTAKEYTDIERYKTSLDVQLKSKEYDFITNESYYSKATQTSTVSSGDWDKFKSDMKKYKSEELVAIYNAAYARYLNK